MGTMLLVMFAALYGGIFDIYQMLFGA